MKTLLRAAPFRREAIARFATLALLTGALGVAGSGCQTLPEPPGLHVEELFHGSLETAQPIDVVVAPVIDESASRGAPTKALREAFQRNLLVRRYSPLALEYVDRKVVSASYRPGTLSEDAVLQVTVRGWDLSRWQSDGEVTAEVEAWMLSAADGTELWGGRLQRTFDLAYEKENHPTNMVANNKASEGIASELLDVMPARTPRP